MQNKKIKIVLSVITLSLSGIAMAEPLNNPSLATTWLKVDASRVQSKLYQTYAYSETMIDKGAACNEGQSKNCQVIKLDETPFTAKKGIIHAVLFAEDPEVSCGAKFDIPYTIQNNNVEISANTSYKAKWEDMDNVDADGKGSCPSTTLTLTVSALKDGFKGYQFAVN